MYLLTGAKGFIGRHLAQFFLAQGTKLVVAARQKPLTWVDQLGKCAWHDVGDINSKTNWMSTLQGVEAVVHCAAHAHKIREQAADALKLYREVNVAGTLQLAQQAATAGVKRFVFVSSIGVSGAQTAPGKPFFEVDQPNPQNAYALSKWEAEQGLLCIAQETDMKVVIVRSPLVYGLNAPGNFGSLIRYVKRGYPLPLGAVHNQRSLVALDNLVDFIATCITHPQAANQTFLVSDGQDLSTTELVRGMAQAAGVPARLIPIPVWALQAGASLLGKGNVVQRLCGNLQVDISKARNLLGWVPPVSVEEGLRRAMSA